MSIFTDRRSRLVRRMKLVEKELSAVDASIRTLTRKLDRRSDELLDREDWRYEEQLGTFDSTIRDLDSPDLFPSGDNDEPFASSLDYEQAIDDGLHYEREIAAVQADDDTGLPYYKKVSADRFAAVKAVVGVARSDTSKGSKKPASSGGDKGLTDYFVSGGLKHAGPLRQERRIQRNKAIFLILLFFLVLSIVCFSIWR